MTEDIFNDLNYIVINKNLDIITVSENLGSAFALDLKLYNNLKQINPSINIDNLEKEISKIFNLVLPNNQINITSLKLKGKEDLFLILFKDISIYNVFLNKLDLAYEEIYIYKQMLNGLKDGVFLTDENGVVLFVNNSFTKLSNLNPNDIIGETVFDLMDRNIVPNSCCAKVLQVGEATSTINDYYNGKSCLVSGHPVFDAGGNLKRVFSIIRDISELEELKMKLNKEKSLSNTYRTKIKELESISKNKTIIGKDKAMSNIYDKIGKVANLDTSVLILGETGVGKDFLSKYIHNISSRGEEGPFLKINCGAIPENLLESELFGYEEGAFTGASSKGKPGLFELANNGTLYLDEIGDMPYNLQVKLLSAIQDKEAYRIGGSKPIKFNSRIITATNVDLEKLILEKKFRIDLYYRLNVISINIPPLRDRKEDIIHLATKFLEEFNKDYHTDKYFSSHTLDMFLIYNWPGNIRELRNLIERLVILSDGDCITKEMFLKQISSDSNLFDMFPVNNMDLFKDDSNKYSLKERMENYEAFIIKETLDQAKSLQEAADILNVNVSTITRKKQKYDI